VLGLWAEGLRVKKNEQRPRAPQGESLESVA
jgi:hypothetical protein